MGCYIRTVCETKRPGEGWRYVAPEIFPNRDDTYIPGEGLEKILVSEPFAFRSYGMFALFGGVRNMSSTAVLAPPRGLPEDVDDLSVSTLARWDDAYDGMWGSDEPEELSVSKRVRLSWKDSHSYSWLSLAELLAFNYDQLFIDQRETPPQETSYRAFLGELFFENLAALRTLGQPEDVRILFCFDG